MQADTMSCWVASQLLLAVGDVDPEDHLEFSLEAFDTAEWRNRLLSEFSGHPGKLFMRCRLPISAYDPLHAHT